LSIIENFPHLAIDTTAFIQAMDRGALDDCLQLLQEDGANPEAAALNCRLSERLFHGGRLGDALECGRRAFAAATDDDEIIDFCAWLFSNCGFHAEAATAYERLIAGNPDWAAGYRHASGSYAAIGDADRAIAYAAKASDLAPDDFDFALHAGGLLLPALRVEEAAFYLARAVAIRPDNPHALQALSAAGCTLGRPDEALTLALQAAALAPQDSDIVVHAAELLLRGGRAAEAVAMLVEATRHDPSHPIPWRVLSAAELQRECVNAALVAIERAIDLAPDTAEFHLHRGHLLYRLGAFAAAAEAVSRAAALDPTNQAAKRAQLDLLLAEGRVTDATAMSGELLCAFPEDEAAAETVLRVLNRRLDSIDGAYVVLGERTRRVQRPPRPEPGFGERLRSQCRVIHALIIRETRTRFGDSRLGYGWALLEPMLHIALLSAVFSLLMRGSPPIGTHFFVFYYTGLIPYHVFVHTGTSMTYAITSNGSLLQLPAVKTFDVILARGLLEFATDIVVAVMLLAGFAALGIPALPDDLCSVATALIVIALLGCGIGFVNAVLQVLFRSWDKLWNNATRLLYFFSGIFYVPGMMPDWARDILGWNPVLHAIDWFRAGFFSVYQPHWLDRRYLLVVAATGLLLGLALERCLRRRLSEPL
jgi:capsular polysaccharide transport system permease protein